MPRALLCECRNCSTCRAREWARRHRAEHRRYVLENYEKVSAKKQEWRRANRERVNTAASSTYRGYTPGDPKILARKKALHAVNTGKLTPQPCEVCGEFPLLRDGRRGVWTHHDDYSKPLEVRWLCVIHHGEAHRQMNIQRHRDIDDVPFELSEHDAAIPF